MKKLPVVKSECQQVFPVVGSPEEGRNKKVRGLRLIGFRLNSEQAIEVSTTLLSMAQVAKNNGMKSIDVLARRSEGPSVLLVQGVLPEKQASATTKKTIAHKTKTSRKTKSASASTVTAKSRKAAKAKKPHVVKAHSQNQPAGEEQAAAA